MSELTVHLLDLPLECLFKICEYLDHNDLLQLKDVCRTFEAIVAHKVKDLCQKMLMVTYHPQSHTNKRICNPLTSIERFTIGSNWISGKNNSRSYSPLYNCRVIVDKDFVYASRFTYIVKLRRSKNVPPGGDPFDAVHHYKSITKCSSFINDFTVNGDTIFEVRSTGEAYIHEENAYKEFTLYPATQIVRSCDFHDRIYATSTELWTHLYLRNEVSELEEMHALERGYAKLLLNQQGNVLFGGCDGALDKLDVESLQLSSLHNDKQNFLCLKNREQQSLLALSTQHLFLFDHRCQYAAQKVFEFGNYSCFDYDGVNGVVLGMRYGGGIHLLDLRKPNKIVKDYYPRCPLIGVKDIACDARYLFGIWYQTMSVFDFKTGF